MRYGSEKSFNFSHIDKNACLVFSDCAKYSICLSFVFPKYASIDISSYRIVFRNCFLLLLIKAYLNSNMKLYAMIIKFPQASVAQKLCDTNSSKEKSFFNSFILFSKSALPRYESYITFASKSKLVTRQLYLYLPKSASSSNNSICFTCLPDALGRFATSCLIITIRLGSFQSSAL